MPGSSRSTERSALAWALFGLSVVALVASLTLSVVLGTWDPQDDVLAVVAAVGLCGMSLIGALIAARTGNGIGWIFLAIALSFWASQVAQDLADHGVPRGASYAEGTTVTGRIPVSARREVVA